MNKDDDLERLIAAFMDGTLDDQGRAEFERRLREDPEALKQTGEAVRFDVELADAMRPDHLEIIQQRRMVIDRVTGKPVIVETSDRVARPIDLGAPHAGKPVGKPRWPLFVLFGSLLGLGGIWWATRKPVTPVAAVATWVAIPLKNPGFELPDLGPGPASSHDVADWQEKFTTLNATVEAAPAGGAHGGKQVLRLAAGGHIKQTLRDSAGEPIVFEPGRKVRLSGWVMPEAPLKSRRDVIHFALHHVDEKLLQYVVCYRLGSLDGSGWRRFSIELTVPQQEMFEPSYYGSPNVAASVTGRPILLSVTNYSYGQGGAEMSFLLDDLTVEVLPAGGGD